MSTAHLRIPLNSVSMGHSHAINTPNFMSENDIRKLIANFDIGPGSITAYSRLSYTMWYALAEFIDNTTQSRENYGHLIDDVLKSEGNPLRVEITYDPKKREMIIADNSIGMTYKDLVAALKIACPTPDSKGRSKYGMG